MNLSGKVWQVLVVCLGSLAIVYHCQADTTQSSVELLLNGNKWSDASRMIFMEAKSADKSDVSIPVEQAKAGFLNDALDTIDGMHPTTQAWAHMYLIAKLPTIPPEHAEALVLRALNLTRKIPDSKWNSLKASTLTMISLYYSVHRADTEARATFEEALKAADSGLTEKGTTAYRPVADAMKNEPRGCQEWMVLEVQGRLKREGKTHNAAFAYRDLAEVAVRLSNNKLATQLIKQSMWAAGAIDGDMRKSLLSDLAIIAIDAGYKDVLLEQYPYADAIKQARAGHPQKSYAIAASFSQTLYVDRGRYIYNQVFNDAIQRGDLLTVVYFAEHSLRGITWVDASTWRQTAELQTRLGMPKEAANSYQKAEQAVYLEPEAIRYSENVKEALLLGASMQRNGYKSKGLEATLKARAMIDLIPERRTADRVVAMALVAESLWSNKMYDEAKQLTILAYRTASGYKGDMEKASLLSALGKVVSAFATERKQDLQASRGVRKVFSH